MALCGATYLIWRIKAADVIAVALAPLGLVFTLGALVTGAIWGKPMWGTWWIWDARLTSQLILGFLYIGYMGLYTAIPNKHNAAKVCAILALVGVVDIPIIHYSVQWWNTLHQGSTLQWRNAPIAPDMLRPLLAMIGGLFCYAMTIALIRIRTEMLVRSAHQQWVRVLLRQEIA
jgi:heme exporter protein C